MSLTTNSNRVVYDLTIYEADGETPMWGDAYYGTLIESSFQTPDDELDHPRPYLMVPENGIATEGDPLNGSTRIGSIQARVLDKRLTATDQGTGIVTARVGDVVGRRAVLRRWLEDPPGLQYGAWVIEMDGVVYSQRLDGVVYYNFEIRDGREFERNDPVFFSNFVLFGVDGKTGPAIDYARPHGHVFAMLSAVPPALSENSRGLNHFARQAAPDPNGIYWGVLTSSADAAAVNAFNIADQGSPTWDPDGICYYRKFWVRWRPAGSSGEWIELRNMPRSIYQHATTNANLLIGSGFVDIEVPFYGVPTLYLGSFVEEEIPAEGQEIEYQIIAVDITEDTPFWWDGGTLGDLLQEIVDGLHTLTPPKERYDHDALAAFALSSPRARFILREPVTDRRRWVEENIYQPGMVWPALNENKEIAPRSWLLPDTSQETPIIDVWIQPPGDFVHSVENAIGQINLTYIGERLDPLKEGASGDDPDTRQPWERWVETEIRVELVGDTPPVPGAQVKEYKPLTIRSIAGVDGRPVSGDIQDDHGNQVAQALKAAVFPRFSGGCAVYQVDITATPEMRRITTGQWVRVRADWLPNYETGTR